MLLRPECAVKRLTRTRSLTDGTPPRGPIAQSPRTDPVPSPPCPQEKTLSLCPAIHRPVRSLTALAWGQLPATDVPKDSGKQLPGNGHLCELKHQATGVENQPSLARCRSAPPPRGSSGRVGGKTRRVYEMKQLAADAERRNQSLSKPTSPAKIRQ